MNDIHPNTQVEDGGFMATCIVYPCYAGPRDGSFYPKERQPLGYKEFNVRGRFIWLWKEVRPEYLDFNVLHRASKLLPSAFDNLGDVV